MLLGSTSEPFRRSRIRAEAANNLGVALLDKGRAGEAAAVLSQLIDAGSAVTETYAILAMP